MKRIKISEFRTNYWNRTHKDLCWGEIYVQDFKVIDLPMGFRFQIVFREQIVDNLGGILRGVREF